jgi:hypothetical protein
LATGKFASVGEELHAPRALIAAPKPTAVEEFLPLTLSGLSKHPRSRKTRRKASAKLHASS